MCERHRYTLWLQFNTCVANLPGQSPVMGEGLCAGAHILLRSLFLKITFFLSFWFQWVSFIPSSIGSSYNLRTSTCSDWTLQKKWHYKKETIRTSAHISAVYLWILLASLCCYRLLCSYFENRAQGLLSNSSLSGCRLNDKEDNQYFSSRVFIGNNLTLPLLSVRQWG